MQVTIKRAAQLLEVALDAGLVIMMAGSPGLGKSSIVKQVATKRKLKVIDLRLAQCDPSDLAGFPSIKNDKASYIPFDTFPIKGSIIPDGYEGWVIFLDEFNSAPMATQAAAYKLVLDRMVGGFDLHDDVHIICAGNLETDNAIVNQTSTAMQSRLVHLEVKIDLDDWINDWGIPNDLDYRIISFLQFQPNKLFTFKPDHNDKTFACPRTWEFANRIIKDRSSIEDVIELVSGCVSDGVAHEFNAFLKNYDNIPKIEDIISNPTHLKVPKEPSILYALTGSIAVHVRVDTMKPIMTYVDRLPLEFRIVCLRLMLRNNKEKDAIKRSDEFAEWLDKNVDIIDWV